MCKIFERCALLFSCSTFIVKYRKSDRYATLVMHTVMIWTAILNPLCLEIVGNFWVPIYHLENNTFFCVDIKKCILGVD